jgi:hypothetical protein
VEVQEVLLCITDVKANVVILMAFSKEVELNLHEEWKLKKSQDII